MSVINSKVPIESKKHILVTDYFGKDPDLFTDILSHLTSDDEFIVYALYSRSSLTNLQKSLTCFSLIIPIVLDTEGGECVLPNNNGEFPISKNIQFSDGFEKVLVDELPDFDLILNFGGPYFVKSFLGKNGRSFYRIQEVPLNKVRTKLRNVTLFKMSNNINSIIHILYEENEGADRLLKLGDKKRVVKVSGGTGELVDLTPPPQKNQQIHPQNTSLISTHTLNRIIVLISYWKLLFSSFIQENIIRTPPVSYEAQKTVLYVAKYEELRMRLLEKIRSYSTKIEEKKYKIQDKYRVEELENELRRVNEKLLRISQRSINFNGSDSNNTQILIEASREKSTAKFELKREKGRISTELRTAKNSVAYETQVLENEKYISILETEIKVIKSNRSKYDRKLKALKKYYNNEPSQAEEESLLQTV